MIRLAGATALVLAVSLTATAATPAARSVEDGKLVLENGFLRVTIDPVHGAALTSVQAKPKNTEMLKAPSMVDSYLLPYRREQSLAGVAFSVAGDKAAAAGREAEWALEAQLPAEVKLTDEQKSAALNGSAWNLMALAPEAVFGVRPLENLRLTKRYRLRDDSAALYVDYELTNTGKTPVEICLGTHNHFAYATRDTRLTAAGRDGAVCFTLPLSGADKKDMLRLDGKDHAWIYDLPDAWTATVDARGKGLVVVFDPRHASFIKVEAADGGTMFARTRVTIAPGEVFRTSAVLTVVDGLGRVHDVADDIIADFEVAPAVDGLRPVVFLRVGEQSATQMQGVANALAQPDISGQPAGAAARRDDLYTGDAIQVDLRLLSARDRKVTATLSTRRNPLGAWTALGKKPIELKAGVPLPLRFGLKPTEKGTYIARVELIEDGKTVASFQHPVIAVAPSGIFRPPAVAKEGVVNDDFLYANVPRASFPVRGDWQPSAAVKTVHPQYATPLAGGPIRALVLTPYYGSRETIELGGRIDLAADTVVLGKRGYRKKFTQYYGVTSNQADFDEIDRVRKFLGEPHEVIILLNCFGDWLPADLMEEIARQVREDGVGLVAVHCDNVIGPLEAVTRTAKREEGSRARTAAVGRGRVAIYDGAVSYARYSIVTTEQEYEDIARHLLWSARGEPAVELQLVTPRLAVDRAAFAADPPTLKLRNRGTAAFRGRVRLTPRFNLDLEFPFYRAVAVAQRFYATSVDAAPAWEAPLDLAPGAETALRPKLPPLPANQYSFDADVLDDKGAVVCWQQAPVLLTAPTEFDTVALSRPGGETVEFHARQAARAFAAHPADTVSVECRLRNPGAAPADRVLLEGRDLWDRVVAAAQAPVAWQGDEGRAVMQVSLRACVHRILVLRLRLMRGVECVREQRVQIFVFDAPERAPVFPLYAYAQVELTPGLGYNVRVGGGGPLNLAWFDIGKAEYGSWIPGCKIIAPGQKEVEKGPDVDLTQLAGDGLDMTKAVKPEEKKPAATEKVDPRNGWIRDPCLNDPAWRKATFAGLEKEYRDYSHYGPFRGFAVDEWFYYKEEDGKGGWRRSFAPGRHTNICRCPYCLKRFSAYAKALYGGDLARLNAEWGTDYKEWAKVDPPVLDPDVKTAPPESMWPHILDHRRFIDGEVPELLGEAQRLIKAIDPGCQTGMSGVWATGIWNGLDISRMAPYGGFNMLYTDLDIWQSFGASGLLNWYGYGNKFNPVREYSSAWSQLFAGMGGVAYYGKEIHPMQRADYTVFDGPRGVFNAMRDIRFGGYDRLLVGHRKTDPIAIYYDPPSIYAAGLEEWTEDAKAFIANWRNAGRSHAELPRQVAYSYRGLLQGRRLQPFWISPGQLEKGSLGRYDPPRVIFLPYAISLGDAQAKTLERFVHEGGVLVGDVQTALRDEHGKRREHGALDAVFGIERRGEWRMRARKNADGKPVVVRFGKEFGEPFELGFAAVEAGEVAATSARPLASYMFDGKEHPAFFVNDYGKGKAVFLNFAPTGFQAVIPAGVKGEESVVKELQGKAAELFNRMFDKIAALGDIRSALDCRDVAVSLFGDGPVTYFGLRTSYHNAYQDEVVREVRLPQKHHLYDSRRGRYLGYADHFTAHFDPQHYLTELLIAALPYKVEGVELKVAAARVKGGQPLEFTARVLPAAAQKQRHVLAVALVDPSGAMPEPYRCSIETRDGVATGRVDLALNDPRGAWKLVVTDAASGTRTEAPFVVE